MTGGAAGHFESSGCLSAAGVAAFRNAPPGGAPEDIAAHVASCARCQERLLEAAVPRPRDRTKGGPTPRAPSLGRTLVLAALTLAALLVALLTLRQLAGR